MSQPRCGTSDGPGGGDTHGDSVNTRGVLENSRGDSASTRGGDSVDARIIQ